MRSHPQFETETKPNGSGVYGRFIDMASSFPLADDIENKKWEEYDGYDKGLKDFYLKEIKEGDINPKFWRKWFIENSKFFMWDEKKSKYKLVNEKDYISHYQLREEANEQLWYDGNGYS